MASDTPIPADDPEYDKWIASTAARCRCCDECQILPCGGCSAGGICDSMCTCPEDDWEDDRDDEWYD